MHKRKLECLTCGATFVHGRAFNEHVSLCHAASHAKTHVNPNDTAFTEDFAFQGRDNSSADDINEDDVNSWETEEDVADEDSNGDALTYPVQDPSEDGDTDVDDDSELSSADDAEADAEESHQAYLLNLKERELIKFLALVERGEGMSTAKAEDILSYIKTFTDERAKLLPKK
jgi:hypothetical protein